MTDSEQRKRFEAWQSATFCGGLGGAKSIAWRTWQACEAATVERVLKIVHRHIGHFADLERAIEREFNVKEGV